MGHVAKAKMFDVQNSGAFRRLLDKEKTTRHIFSNQPLFVPGLLQEPAYAEATIRGFSGLPEGDAELADRVKQRNERHAAFLERLQGDDAPEIHAIIDESVLRRSSTMSEDARRKQIEHLIDISRHPKVHIGIMPLDHGPHRGLCGSFEVHDDLVFFEDAEGDRILDDAPDRIARYRDLVGSLMSEAASGDEARVLLGKLIGH
jgi:hypothetical protein